MSTKPVAKTHHIRVGHAVQTVLVWVMAVIFLAPLYFVVLNSFKTKGEISISATTLPTFLNLENYVRILEDDYFVSSFLTSVGMVVVVTSLTCLVAAMAGYALARWKSKLSTGLNLAIMSTLFVPFQVYMVAMIIVVRQIGLTGNLIGLALVYIAMGMPVPIFLARSYATGMSIEIEEAAIIDGCSRPRMFFSIVLPLMKPVLATIAVLNALWVWGEYLVAFLVYGTKKPMTLPVSQQYFYGTYSNQWNLILAGFVVSTLPIVIFYIVMQKHIVKGIAAGAVKG